MKCYSIKELCTMLGIGIATAYRLVHTDGFPVARVGNRLLIPEEGLKAWIANGGTAADTDY